MPFVKGQSGNPKGRPSTRAALAPALRALLGKRADPDGKTNKELVLDALLQTAFNGDVQAMKLIFERIDGKVPEPVEVSGPAGGPIILQWAHTGDDEDTSGDDSE